MVVRECKVTRLATIGPKLYRGDVGRKVLSKSGNATVNFNGEISTAVDTRNEENPLLERVYYTDYQLLLPTVPLITKIL